MATACVTSHHLLRPSTSSFAELPSLATMYRAAVLLVAGAALACVLQSTTALPTSGSSVLPLPFPVSGGFHALGGSLVIVTNGANNTVQLIDTDTGKTLTTSALTTAPSASAVSASAATVWTVPRAGSFLMVSSVLTGAPATTVPLPCQPSSVALGADLAFVPCGKDVLAINVHSLQVVGSVSNPASYSPLVAAASDSRFFLANAAVSSGGDCVWSVSATTSTSGAVAMKVSRGINGGCENGNTLAASTDGKHVAFATGGGNCGGYNICDFSGANISRVLGEYSTGAYPTGAAFSRDNSMFASSNGMGGPELFVFGASRHNVIKKAAMPSPCEYMSPRDVQFSTDGRRVYLSVLCGFDATTTQLFWIDV